MLDLVVAIDPGTRESGVCLVSAEDYRPLWCAKVENSILLGETLTAIYDTFPVPSESIHLVIERMHNPMSADSNVFLTCEWIGRFDVMFQTVLKGKTEYVFRHEEYKCLCANMYPRNDKGIRQALVERFAYGQPNFGKGTKANKGWFYGFSADCWQSYAIACTYLDRAKERT